MKLKIKLVPITQYQTPYTALSLSLSFPLYFSLALTHSVSKRTYSFQSLTFILYLSLGPLTSVFFVLPRSFYNTSFSLSHPTLTCSYTLLSLLRPSLSILSLLPQCSPILFLSSQSIFTFLSSSLSYLSRSHVSLSLSCLS